MLAAPFAVRADAPAPDDGAHFAVSAGFGTAYDLAGLRVEVDWGHLGAFASLGCLGLVYSSGTLSAPGTFSVAAGLRGYAGVRKGAFLSLNFTGTYYSTYYSFDEASNSNPRIFSGTLFTGTLTIGYRWRLDSGLTFEIALGGGLYRDQEPISTAAAAPPPPGAAPPPSHGLIPDASLGIGYEF